MKFTRYMMWNFLKMFLLVLLGAILMFAVIDFVGNIKTCPRHQGCHRLLRELYPLHGVPDYAGRLVHCGTRIYR